jgi:hypothetical protein
LLGVPLPSLSSVPAAARGGTHVELGVEHRGDELDLAQPGLVDGALRIEQPDDAALPESGAEHYLHPTSTLTEVCLGQPWGQP